MLAPSNYLKVHSQENGILSLTLDDQAWAKTQHSSWRQFIRHEFLGHLMDNGFIFEKLPQSCEQEHVSVKGQLISKWFLGSSIFSRKRTNVFDFTTMIPQVDLF